MGRSTWSRRWWPTRREDRPESSWANVTWALLKYVVVPTALITVIMWRYPELEREHFLWMLRWILIAGTALVGLAALRGEHRTGTVTRLVLDVSYVILTIGWLLGLLGGGTVIHQTWKGYEFSIDIKGLFILVAALASLNLVYYGLRFAQKRGYLPEGGDDPSPDTEPTSVTIEYAD